MRKVFLTGANRGLGLEMARQLLARGDWVLATARRPEQAVALQALARQHPNRLQVLALDVADPRAVQRVAQQAAEATQALDVLINNAGVLFEGERLGHLEAERLCQAFRVNAVGPVLLTQALLPLLQGGRRPVVFNLSTQLASLSKKTFGGYYGYAASKAALNMFTRTLAAELRPQGIIVVAVHPGWVQTDMGGPQAPLQPATSVAGMLRLLDGLTLAHSGGFYTWEGREHPW